MLIFRWFALIWTPLYFGGGPSKSQKRAQREQRQLAQEAADREVAREQSLKVRILARQRARRLGQFGRRSLAFNPGAKDLTTPVGAPATAETLPDTTRRFRGATPGGNVTTGRTSVMTNTAPRRTAA